ncbi:hypothetical protein CCR75_001948 [Bremia lactucae]|uniref:Uncharacterized protein n=1 Tax=Bremia lactucae TaxID=4779 RepID=A0A976IDI6_BRELC|nr:hypothetical protein CCR75_001948 [Bremia lactucae]
MPQSRELANKKNDHKDRHSRGPMGLSAAGPKKGMIAAIKTDMVCAHNWGVSTAEEDAIVAVDRKDPNYDSSEEQKVKI